MFDILITYKFYLYSCLEINDSCMLISFSIKHHFFLESMLTRIVSMENASIFFSFFWIRDYYRWPYIAPSEAYLYRGSATEGLSKEPGVQWRDSDL